MQPDDDLCLCFHVSWRKVINYIRVHRVVHPSQVSECQSAGTGCGWCRKAIARLTERIQVNPPQPDDLSRWLLEEYPASSQHVANRETYLQDRPEGQDLVD